MKIIYSPREKVFELNDGIKTSLFLSKFLMFLTFANAILFLRKELRTEDNFLIVFWILLGLISVLVLLFLIIKKSNLKSIPLTSVLKLKGKNILGMERYSLVLKNGKHRDISGVNSSQKGQELKSMLAGLGVKIQD